MSGRLVSALRSTTYAILAAALAVSAPAQEVGEQVEGVIAEVDGRSLTVDREGGGQVTVRLGARTHVVVQPRQGGHFPNASAEFLKPGMGVRFKYAEGPLDRVHVTSVPAGAWPETAEREEPRASARQEKVRILKIGRSGDFVADNAGRSETFTLKSSAVMRGHSVGDLVILTLDANGDVTSIRSAAQTGRVVRVDARAGRVVVETDGREVTYTVEDRDLVADIEAGDRIRFDVEERPNGRSVIVAIH